ncbi:MAG TPA: type II secretion system protein GspG [Thermoanaerobaculia bacterium]|jgi:general secretion pathway protein G|nr:type II secretion system protein GspG [Thermoanaerobaculia bacterium]
MPFCAYCGTPVDAISYAPCPSCGNPRNGAPRPAVKKGGNAAIIIAAVVIGGLVVLAIGGILAAIAIPNLLTAMQRTRQKRTMADMSAIGTAVEAYGSDQHKYPTASELDSLMPKYVRNLPRTDGWEHPYLYQCWSTHGGTDCDAYAIGSAGKDGVFERNDLKEYLDGSRATTNFNSDIVFANGSFVQYPEGVQH